MCSSSIYSKDTCQKWKNHYEWLKIYISWEHKNFNHTFSFFIQLNCYLIFKALNIALLFLRVTKIHFLLKSISLLPNSGLLSVTGIIAETMFKNIVKLSRIVTPGKLCSLKSYEHDGCWWCSMIICICSRYKCPFFHGYEFHVKPNT